LRAARGSSRRSAHGQHALARVCEPQRSARLGGLHVRLLAAALCIGLGSACRAAAPASSPEESETSRSEPVSFSFAGVDGESVSSETTRGRSTVLAFITTYDIASQLVVRRLGELIVGFTPRANAAAVVLEPPRYADLLPAYSASLGLPFPVVMADFETLQGRGHFGSIDKVPTLVVFDREGREVWRRQGPLTSDEMAAALRLSNSRPGGS
jgi:hypothetical protein